MSLQVKKKELELARVRMARQELEFKVEEHMADIERLQGHIEVQKQAEKRLAEEMAALQKD